MKQNFIVIFTNHDATLNIVKQISITTTFIDKLNFCFIRTSNYIQRFNVELRYKLEKQHIVFDALSRFVSINTNIALAKKKLNTLFTIVLIKIEKSFRRKLIAEYIFDLNWKAITSVLNQQVINAKNSAKLLFYRKNNLIFRSDDFTIDNHAYESYRLCISQSIIQNILVVAHDNNHFDFARCYEKISTFYYIRDLFKYFWNYLKHCFKCQTYQIRRYKPYKSLQSILILFVFFHIVTIDFILTLSISL